MSRVNRRVGTRAAADAFDFELNVSLNELLPEQAVDSAQVATELLTSRMLGDTGLTIAGCVPSASTRNLLDAWSLVAGRDPDGHRTEVHALGSRLVFENIWITSVLAGIDLLAQVVSTQSGHVYRLGTEGVPELSQSLGDHLIHALRTRGFTDVEP